MTTDCHSIRAMMQAALDHELEGEAAAAFDDHLASCPGCASKLESLKLSLAVLAAMPVPKPGPSFAARVAAQAKAAGKAREKRNRAFMWAMAASVLIASAAVLGAWSGLGRPLLWDAVAAVPRALTGLGHGLAAAGSLLQALSRPMLPLGSAAVTVSWHGLMAFFPGYMLALASIVFLALLTRSRRPAVRMPVLSL
jgi:predicted anti-sigma-YlaC factor YlaD